MTNSVKIVYKNRNVVVINKPVGMPSQSDTSGDLDAMTATSELLSEIGEESSLWLVHRLDRAVGGLIAFARNKRSAAELSKIVANSEMEKRYLAVCHGEAKSGEYRDLLFKDSITSKAYVVKTERKGAKDARLVAEVLEFKEEKSLVSVNLQTGRFHQIRAQFSARGNSLVGDKKYGSRDSETKAPALFANRLSFKLFGKTVSISAIPDIDNYPWNIFSKENFDEKKESKE